MRIAAIDIGTNTILLLIAEARHGAIQRVLHDEQVIARLGEGVDADRIILPATFERAGKFLESYKATCDRFAVDSIVAVGTSALRDARNSEDFCRYILQRTGISIEILSGAEEAQWTYRGSIADFIPRATTFSVLDIGGGSTEIITGTATGIRSSVSLDIGSVRITERILKSSPPSPSAIHEARTFIRSHITKELSDQLTGSFTIGVAGTLTSLAAIDLSLPIYDRDRVNGHWLSIGEVRKSFERLKGLTKEEIRAIPQITPGREDIILAGILILLTVMETAGMEGITVSDRGLRYGIVERAAGG